MVTKKPFILGNKKGRSAEDVRQLVEDVLLSYGKVTAQEVAQKRGERGNARP